MQMEGGVHYDRRNFFCVHDKNLSSRLRVFASSRLRVKPILLEIGYTPKSQHRSLLRRPRPDPCRSHCKFLRIRERPTPHYLIYPLIPRLPRSLLVASLIMIEIRSGPFVDIARHVHDTKWRGTCWIRGHYLWITELGLKRVRASILPGVTPRVEKHHSALLARIGSTRREFPFL